MTHKLLLIMLIFSLAALPLRSAFSTPIINADDAMAHCADMQDTGSELSSIPEDSAPLCANNCCSDSCDMCITATAVLSNEIESVVHFNETRISSLHGDILSTGTLNPPFRPPIFLHNYV